MIQMKCLNYDNKLTVIYYIDYTSGGLCDILKFFNFAQYICENLKINIKFFINTYLKHFLIIDKSIELNNSQLDILKKVFKDKNNYLKYNTNSSKKQTFKEFIDNYTNKYLLIDSTDFYRLKNINFELPIDMNYKNYNIVEKQIFYNTLDFINFDESVYSLYENIKKENTISDNYYVLHLRCGDKYLDIKPKDTYFCSTDTRYKDLHEILKKIKLAIHTIKNKENYNNENILFICDSNIVKKIMN